VLNPVGEIRLAPFEAMDRIYVTDAIVAAGFTGTLQLQPMKDAKKVLPDGKVLTDLVNELGNNEGISAVIVDSLGVIISEARDKGTIGEAFMGDRAKMIADFARRAEAKLRRRTEPATVLCVNHVGPVIGGRGHVTSGGVILKFAAVGRVYMYRKENYPASLAAEKKETEGSARDGFLAEGTIEKLRYGGKGRKFLVYLVPSQGVNKDITAMFDCIRFKFAQRTKQGIIKIGTTSYGRIGTLITAGKEGKHGKFDPFYELLETNVYPVLPTEEEEEADEGSNS
jgi:hypothetical protein